MSILLNPACPFGQHPVIWVRKSSCIIHILAIRWHYLLSFYLITVLTWLNEAGSQFAGDFYILKEIIAFFSQIY